MPGQLHVGHVGREMARQIGEGVSALAARVLLVMLGQVEGRRNCLKPLKTGSPWSPW